MDIGDALRQYKCSKCRLTFTHLGNLVYHEKAAHDVVETKAPFKCNECNHTFLLEEALNYHQKTEHGYEIESFDCDKCNWKFFSKAASYVHKKMHHHSEDLEGEAFFRFFTFDTHTFQIGHFCFNILLTGIVQPHSVLT